MLLVVPDAYSPVLTCECLLVRCVAVHLAPTHTHAIAFMLSVSFFSLCPGMCRSVVCVQQKLLRD